MAVALLVLSSIVTTAYLVALLRDRPVLNGEGEILSEAARLRLHLPLYTDPLAGAFDQGPYPTRAYVLYPPLWSWVLSFLPAKEAPLLGRVVGGLMWMGTLLLVLRTAARRERRAVAVATLYLMGSHLLATFAVCARPDTAAVCLAALALLLAVRRAHAGPLCGALFALAAWLKPNVVGLGAGVAVALLLERPFSVPALLRRLLPPLTGVLAVSVPVACILYAASDGSFVDHLRLSVGQALRLDLWWDQVSRRLLFLGPFALVLTMGWRGRRDPRVRIAFFAVAVNLGWMLFCFAKVGAASNYWMEPALGAVILVAYAPWPAWSERTATTIGALAIAHAIWLAGISAEGVLEAFEKLPARTQLVQRARATCRTDPSDVILSDSAGIEYMANGRVLAPFFQTHALISAGRLPASTWVGDVLRPEAKCFLAEGPLPDIASAPAVHEALTGKFVLEAEAGDLRLYRAR
ncbi:hypothetical protein LZC95_40050 [Pendulispora brunnea]|uniref:Glycosyltransferase RgtA/B/C/D-like domain-containing protein n=1 Tax=Pendulispora brunnea TaxID=2905690 RepID=A0ABZ2K1M2_9BACT